MPDTIRSMAELDSLLSDNAAGSISAQDIRDLMVSMAVHGEIGSGAKANKTLGADWEALDFDVAGTFVRGLNVDTVNKWIDGVPVTMKALLSMELFFKGDEDESYDFTVFKDPIGSPVNITRMERADVLLTDVDQTVQLSWSVGVQLTAGDILQPSIRSNGNDFELMFGLFRVQRIGVE